MSFYSIMWLYQAWNAKNKNAAVITHPNAVPNKSSYTTQAVRLQKSTIKAVHITQSLYSKSSEAIWQFGTMNLPKIKVSIFGYIQLSDQI